MLLAQRILATSMCISHLVLGLSILLRFGPVGNSPAWSVLAEIWSDWGSPSAFLAMAALAGAGWFRRRWLQACFYVGAVVMFIWAGALSIAWAAGYGPQPSIIWLANVGIVKWCVGYFWLAYEQQAVVNQEQTVAVDRASHRLARTIHRSEQLLRGHDADDPGAD